jgi:NAD(P)H-nitrite reductase large subunit
MAGRNGMDEDAEVCLCFHVTRGKLLRFLRVERPQRASQLSECFGAGTGCGWCRPFLEQMFAQARCEPAARGPLADLPERAEYAQQRDAYLCQGQGTPPAEAGHGD